MKIVNIVKKLFIELKISELMSKYCDKCIFSHNCDNSLQNICRVRKEIDYLYEKLEKM